MPAEVFALPVEDKFILYRPLARVAFIGNRAMAELVASLPLADGAGADDASIPQEPMTFLRTIGFLGTPLPVTPPASTVYQPTSAVLLLTNRCNLRCVYCYANGGAGPAETLSLDLARTAIDYAYENARTLNHPSFDLTFHGGGEPVQAWDVIQAATTHAREKDLPCRISMVSNGVWSSPQREWIMRNIDTLSISFDGQPNTQNRQRPIASGQGSFKAVMRTIEELDKAKFAYGIRMTATPPWNGRLADDVRFICEHTACPSVQVEPAFNRERGQHQGPTAAESRDFANAFIAAFEVAQQAKRGLNYSGARPGVIAQVFCTAPYGALVVNPAGNLVACYEIADSNHPLAQRSRMGRISGSQIEQDPQARQALMTYLEHKRAKCEACFCYWHCAGDCYTRGYFAEASSTTGSNPRCEMNREITMRLLLWYIMAGNGVWQGRDRPSESAALCNTF